MRPALAAVLFLTSIGWSVAQESAVQQTNPPGLKWYQINTPGFQILYPQGIDQQAQHLANTLERVRIPESRSMGVRPKKISIILQNQSSVSNAFVMLAPRHSEFYAMPSQNYNFLGTNDWLTLLSSHEYRHVVQFQRAITGFNKFFYYIFGQQAVAGFAAAAAPQWFWEGDAVATETAFTHSGRGRIPNFNLLLRTNFLEGRTFRYNKAYLESYKNKIPDWYVLGYHMVSYLREKTGDKDIWEKIVKRSWGHPFIPFTFSNAIHRETGLYVNGLYREMAGYLTTKWKSELEGLPITAFESVTIRPNAAYTDYLYPQVLRDGTVVAQKSGIGDIEQLVVLKREGEEKAYVQGMMNPTGMMSGEGSKIVWNEFRFDPRWQVRTYTIVKGYDFATRKETVISRKSRYASAALSPDASRVVTVETGTDYQTRLVVLDYATGAVLNQLPNPTNDFISMPRWSEDGNSIIALKTNKEGRTITRYDIVSGKSADFFPPAEENLGYPVPAGKYILYNSPYSQIDNIYALDTESGSRYQITCSKYGAYNAALSPDKQTLYYNEQTRNGFDVVKIPFDPRSWRPLAEVKGAPGFYEHLARQEGQSNLLDSIPDKAYPVTRLHRASQMINTHSWGPYFSNSFAQAQLGIFSQDILSTTSINGGYQYDLNERTGSWQAGISYQGFFPILDFQLLAGNREQKTSVTDNEGRVNVKLDWKETGTTLGLRVPLVFTRSKYFSSLEFGNYLGVTQVSSFRNYATRGDTALTLGNTSRYVPIKLRVDSGNVQRLDNFNYLLIDQLSNGTLLSNYFYVNYTHLLKESTRDFNPKFGQALYFDSYSTPYGGKFNGNLWDVRGLFFFPGLFKHHSLFFRTGYQSSLLSPNTNTYTFRNQLFKPRGYAYPNDSRFYTLQTNYQLPVWYADVALGPLLNVQRIKANLFYDFGNGQGSSYLYDVSHPALYVINHSVNYISEGVEMTFDINVMRLLQQVEVGFRISHITANAYNNSGMVFEFLIGNIPF
jgi:hypothetical protein